MARTPYAETEVLLAILDGDEEKAAALIGAMTAFEQHVLREALDNTLAVVDETPPTVL